MTATAVILSPGDSLGGFEIGDVIGIGGMAVVYRARQASLDREVALKVLSPDLARDESFSDRFRAEGMHAARLDHPNVIPVYDAGEVDGRLYLAMRLVEGMSLAERLRARSLTVKETLEILSPIAAGLDAAHAIGLIHRDVKPQNILLTEDGHPYLADFGVAKGVESAGLTASGGFVGTLNYAAPEQILGLATTAATDVYALTAVLYHCLTGMVPFPRDTQAGLMFAQVNQSPPRIPVADADEFNLVILRGMAKDPEERFSSAGELMLAADRAVGHLRTPNPGSRPAFSVGPATPTWAAGPGAPRSAAKRSHQAGRRPVVVMVVALALAAAAIAAKALDHPAAAAARRVAHSPPLTVQYSAPWSPTLSAFAADVLRAPGSRTPAAIQLHDGLASLAGGFLSRSSVVPGEAPPVLVSRFGPPRSQVVRGSAVAIYHWTLSGVRNLTAWVVPTVRGDLAIICSAPVEMTGALRACETMASRAGVSGVARLRVGPDRELARSVARIVSKAAVARRTLNRMFSAHASKPASVPRGVAAADELARRNLHKLNVPSRYRSAVFALASDFGTEADALMALSAVTSANRQSAYTSRSRKLKEESGDLSLVSSRLRRDGLLASELSPLVIPSFPVTSGSTVSGNGAGSTAALSATSSSGYPTTSTGGGYVAPIQASTGGSSSGSGTGSGGRSSGTSTTPGTPIH